MLPIRTALRRGEKTSARPALTRSVNVLFFIVDYEVVAARAGACKQVFANVCDLAFEHGNALQLWAALKSAVRDGVTFVCAE